MYQLLIIQPSGSQGFNSPTSFDVSGATAAQFESTNFARVLSGVERLPDEYAKFFCFNDTEKFDEVLRLLGSDSGEFMHPSVRGGTYIEKQINKNLNMHLHAENIQIEKKEKGKRIR